MNVPLTLAGAPAAWRFRDSAGLENWLGARPWSGRGGWCVVRIASADLVGPFLRAIRQSVRAHDDGGSDVQTHLADPVQVHQGLWPTLQTHLDFTEQPDRRSALQVASRLFGYWPTLVVLPAVLPGTDPRLLPEVRELVEQVSKQGACATLVLIDTPATALATEAFDLTVGGLADPVLGDSGQTDPELWRAYVHARLAWESAGDLGRAQAWDSRGFASLAPGKDNLLENLLNQCAESAGQQLSAVIIDQALEHLRLMIARKSSLPPEALLRAGAFWRPPGESQARPAPWLARALLRSEAFPDASFHLRGCLSCAPLAREILTHCFDLESRQRSIGWAQRGSLPPPTEAEDRFRKFLERAPGSGAEFYPADCPATPTDAWAFTLLGEFIAALPLDRHTLGVHHDLRSLRNALAHGHYISWAMLMTLRRIERQLSG